MNKVIYTGEIPQCPYCEKPTQRKSLGASKTLLFFTPTFNKEGVNKNPDINTIKQGYKCQECLNNYGIKGNPVDGFKYHYLVV